MCPGPIQASETSLDFGAEPFGCFVQLLVMEDKKQSHSRPAALHHFRGVSLRCASKGVIPPEVVHATDMLLALILDPDTEFGQEDVQVLTPQPLCRMVLQHLGDITETVAEQAKQGCLRHPASANFRHADTTSV